MRTARASSTQLIVLLIVLLLIGCGSVKKDRMANRLQSATHGYESALRWGYFGNAYGFVDPERRQDEPMPALEGLRLTGYDVVQPPRIAGDEQTATQIVALEYLHEDKQVVKTLVDQQIWRWDETSGSWWLKSGLPRFE